jgi:hypothetical protein
LEYPQKTVRNRQKASKWMKRFWENLSEDEKIDLCLAFKQSWTKDKKKQRKIINKNYWNSLSESEKQFRLERLHSGIKSTSSLETRIQRMNLIILLNQRIMIF